MGPWVWAGVPETLQPQSWRVNIQWSRKGLVGLQGLQESTLVKEQQRTYGKDWKTRGWKQMTPALERGTWMFGGTDIRQGKMDCRDACVYQEVIWHELKRRISCFSMFNEENSLHTWWSVWSNLVLIIIMNLNLYFAHDGLLIYFMGPGRMFSFSRILLYSQCYELKLIMITINNLTEFNPNWTQLKM